MKDDREQLFKKAERKAQSRQKKKKPEMRVSGKSVFKLKNWIKKDKVVNN